MTKLISTSGDYAKMFAISNFTKICSVGAELMYVDGRTDGHDKANKRFGRLCENV